MRLGLIACLFLLPVSVSAQTTPAQPQDPHALKTFNEAKQLYARRQYFFARDGFKKADKQDGGHCAICKKLAYDAALDSGDYKSAQELAMALSNEYTEPRNKAGALFLQGNAAFRDGLANNHDKSFLEADRLFKESLVLESKGADVYYLDGITLAHLKQDEAAQAQFREYLKLSKPSSVSYKRAERFIERPELARARMTPPFRVQTVDGKIFSVDENAGKVVLIDFWATWCGPCRESLPHVREIAKRFAGPNFQVLSVSLDSNDSAWREFIAKNEMTWPQYRDGSFTGNLSTLFSVHAIPHTFVIDADGVLQDEKVGDASIEGKLKKLIARAQQLQQTTTAATHPDGQ